MPAPKASEVGANLERIDEAIEALKDERKEYEKTARSMLERGIAIKGPSREYYLNESTTFTVAPGILDDKRIPKNIRDQLVDVDSAKARKLFEEGLIPADVWAELAEGKSSVAMRFKRLKPATAERKKALLEAAA